MLLDYGADVNAPTTCGEFPVHWATQNMDIMTYLLGRGAHFSIPILGPTYWTPLHYALGIGYPKLGMVELLLKLGHKIKDFSSTKSPPLLEVLAERFENDGDSPRIFKLLLNAGADINGSCIRESINWNCTLTHLILNDAENTIIFSALDAGADVHCPGGSDQGRTPLQAAAQRGNIEVVKELLRRGGHQFSYC